MRLSLPLKFGIMSLLFLTLLLTGCGYLSGLLSEPAPKPEIGPAGKPVESKPNPPFIERFFQHLLNYMTWKQQPVLYLRELTRKTGHRLRQELLIYRLCGNKLKPQSATKRA